jgi:DNA-binding MarR family transcriptional regulator
MARSAQPHPILELMDELIRVNARLRSVFGDTSAVTGLNGMQNAVLTAVTEAKTPPTVPQIGRSLGHPRQVIQRAANVLLAEGLIDATPNPDHKRAPLLVATATGRKLKQKMDRRAIKAADELLQQLEPTKCRQLIDDIHELRGALEAAARSKSK